MSARGNRSFRLRYILFLFFSANVLNAECKWLIYYFSFLKRLILGKEKAIYLISRSLSASKVNQLALGEKTRRRNDR